MRGPALALLLLPGAAAAQGVVPDPDVALPPGVDCLVPDGADEVRLCAQAAWAEAEAERDQALRIALTNAQAFDEGRAEDGALTLEAALALSGEAWFAHRDAECAAEAIVGRAAGAEALALYGCLERLTRRRVEDLALFGAVE